MSDEERDFRWPTTASGVRFRLVCAICGRDLGDRPTDEKCCNTYMRRHTEPDVQQTLFGGAA